MKKIISILMVAIMTVSVCNAGNLKAYFNVTPKMSCENCENKIKSNLRFEKGVKSIETSVKDELVTVTYDPAKTTVDKIQAAFAKIGYTATVATPGAKACADKKCDKAAAHQCKHDCKGEAAHQCKHDCKGEAAVHQCKGACKGEAANQCKSACKGEAAHKCKHDCKGEAADHQCKGACKGEAAHKCKHDCKGEAADHQCKSACKGEAAQCKHDCKDKAAKGCEGKHCSK